MQGKQIIIDGQLIHYYTNAGKSEDNKNICIFLHGWMQDGQSFQALLEKLDADTISYYILDLPGFGKSPLSNIQMSIEDYADIVRAFIEKLDIQNPYLIGHSFGGRISIYLRSMYNNLTGVILIGSAGFAKDIGALRNICNKVGKYLFSLPGLRGIGKRIRNTLLSADAQNTGKLETVFRNTISRDLSEEMKIGNIKTLILHGKYDDQVSVSDAQKMHSYIQNSELHILDGGHFLHQEYTQEVYEYITQFIEQ